MRKAVINSHLTPEELKERMIESESRGQFQRWQALYLMNTRQYGAEEAAKIVGVSQGTVYQWIHRYNHNGPESLRLIGRGGRTGGIREWTG